MRTETAPFKAIRTLLLSLLLMPSLVVLAAQAAQAGDILTNYPQDVMFPGANQPTINAMVRAADGTMIFATSRGVVEFDGTTWTNYQASDNPSWPAVGAVAIDRDGAVWYGLSSGVRVKDASGNWTAYDPTTSQVNDIAVDANNNVWLATSNGLAFYDRNTWTVYTTANSDLSDNIVHRVDVAPDGKIWIGSILVHVIDGTTWTTYGAESGLDDTTYNFAFDSAGNVWVCEYYGGVAKFDGTGFTRYGDDQGEFFYAKYMNSVAVDNNDVAWATFDGGVARFDGSKWSLYLDPAGGLISDLVRSKDIVIEPDGTKWFGTWYGVTRVGPAVSAAGTDSAESFEQPATDWTTIDNDGDGYTWSRTSATDTGADVAHSGDYGMRVQWNSNGNDDWLIGPQIDLTNATGGTLSFWARSEAGFLESFNVKLSTTGTAPTDFTVTLAQVTDAPSAWTQYTYKLDAYAGQKVYLAIQCISVDQLYLSVDDFTLQLQGNSGMGGGIMNSGTSEQLNWVHFVDANNGWVVGTNATILHTGDGGLTWTPQTSPIAVNLYACFFVDAQYGWIVGGSETSRKIIHTTDSGSTWTEQTSVKPTNRPISVFFLDRNTGWIVGDAGAIEKTTDGGATWVAQTSGTTNHILDVHFVDANTGWFGAQYGQIYATTDGGTTWTQQTSGVETTNFDDRHFGNLDFVDANNGWAVGRGGIIVHTADGGAHWTTQDSGSTELLYAIDFVDTNNGLAVGQNGTILATTDGGTTWTPEESGTDFSLLSVAAASPDQAWVVGVGGTILAYGGNQQVGTISGTVTTSLTGGTTSIAGATVTVVETGQKVTTDANGNYTINNVPSGTYTLRIEKDYFETITLNSISVATGQTTTQQPSDMTVPSMNAVPGDVNNDGKIGLEDVIYTLQLLLGTRSTSN